jgi:alanyl-tRNA synthetase
MEAKAVDFPETKGMQGGRIFYYSEKKNWWSRAGEPAKMPAGEPGGPDSEMFWDFGEKRGMHENSEWKDQPCHVNCDCGRFVEIGNNVFMEYMKTQKGFEKLTQRNVDFGGGLERIAAAVQDNPDIFMISAFANMRSIVEQLSQKTYGKDPAETRAFRIVLDHLRGSTFLISDGAVPSNRDQGYFTRRMVRRAVRFAGTLGITENFCSSVAEAVIETYANAYPDLLRRKQDILSALEMEETQFRRTLVKGEKELQDYLKNHQEIDGAKVFYFFETYGFPRELTEELLKEKHLNITKPETYEEAQRQHQELSRITSGAKFKGGLQDHSAETTKLHTATHLLNAALRQVLGEHVSQKGSNITAERLRFDFNHGEKMTPEQIQKVEELVNEAIEYDLPIAYHVTTVEGAKSEGAVGVFDARYGAEVKVYTVGNKEKGVFSKEICGGPHVARTGMLGSFKIQKEESSSAGVRRIKAIVEGGPQEIETARLES